MFLRVYLRPKYLQTIIQSRSMRPSIKMGKEKFQISMDVKHFNKDELRVKAKEQYVVIEGKQERKTKNGLVIKQFVRKYKLPRGCNPSTIKTSLSADGILTVTAPRCICDTNMPCETLVPITFTEAKEESLVTVQKPDQKDGKS